MKTVLIVTHQHGFEADPVIDNLRGLDIPVFRFNLDPMDGTSNASVVFGNDGCDLLLGCDGRFVSGEEIGMGWCQQLWPDGGDISNQMDLLRRRNLVALHSGAFDLLDIQWLNRPTQVELSSNKVRQISYARQVGFPIMETLISNAPDDIRNFCKRSPSIAKNLATPWTISERGHQAAYTKLVQDEWLNSDQALSFSPVIYQKFCERQRDIRVVVIGDEVFAAHCIPGPDQMADVRIHGSTGQGFEPCDFGEERSNRLIELMDRLSIEYCSADFMESKDGTVYFLETNVCGAWWWVDRLYDGAICRAIANYLRSRI